MVTKARRTRLDDESSDDESSDAAVDEAPKPEDPVPDEPVPDEPVVGRTRRKRNRWHRTMTIPRRSRCHPRRR
jgi:hypothetical protein